MEHIIVLITAPTEDEAAKIGTVLVEERLAACANIIKGVRSIYRWEEKVEDEPEVLMVIKTRKDLFGAVSTRVSEIHSYTVPEVIALPIGDGSQAYLNWIEESTKQP